MSAVASDILSGLPEGLYYGAVVLGLALVLGTVWGLAVRGLRRILR